LAFLIASGLLVCGCAQTVSQSSEVQKSVSSNESPAATGFFGSELSLLQPGQQGQAAMIYVDPNANWKQYDKILLEPVEFWDDPETKVSPEDQDVLTAYFYNALMTELQKNFTLVNQGGPGVLQLQVALVNATATIPGLRTVSVVVPQARILNLGQSLATGAYAFAGSAQAEMKATDSVTGQFLAGAIDQRGGGMAMSTALAGTWGDAENAMNYWAEKIASRLLELQGRQPAPATN
jgi:hypothetical protein